MNIALLILICILSVSSCSEANKPLASELILSTDYIELHKGDRQKIDAYITNESNPTIKWASSDSNIATVSENGLITAHNIGKADIIASYDNLTAQCNINVIPETIESIELNTAQLIIIPNEEIELKVTTTPENSNSNTNIIWTSSNPEIASVNNGLVKGLEIGQTIITVSSGNMSSECSITVMEAPQIGDYYYHDGTYSTELDNSKMAIGVIFWTGNPTKDDITLKKEHEYCTHGLVVSSKSNHRSSWQSNFSMYNSTIGEWIEKNTDYISPTCEPTINSNLNKIMGYNNTKCLVEFNNSSSNSNWEVEIVDAFDEIKNNLVTPPSISSGWYIPSAKELSLLCTGEYNENIWEISGHNTSNFEYINSRLNNIYDSDLLSDTRHWSSSEISNNYAYVVYFGDGTVKDYQKDYDTFFIRGILAF